MRSLLYISIILIASACGFVDSQSGELDVAQNLMQSDPAEALSRLNKLDISEFQDSATMARWALLYTEAMAVNRLSAPSDTIVNIAIDYYGRYNLTEQFQKASHLKDVIKSNESDALTSALYLQKEKEFLLYKERANRRLLTFICIFIIFAAIAIILWMRQRIKLQQLQNETLMAEASGLKNRIEQSCGDVDRLETKLRGLLENRFTLIDSLCQTYYESQGTKIERKAIIDKVKNEIESVRTDSFPKMEQAVNDCRNNLLVKIKSCYPEIKPEDYQLLVYLAGRLSTRTISLLLGESVDVIYKRKSRLKSRLKNIAEANSADISAIF